MDDGIMTPEEIIRKPLEWLANKPHDGTAEPHEINMMKISAKYVLQYLEYLLKKLELLEEVIE